jgi:hypothetical protein
MRDIQEIFFNELTRLIQARIYLTDNYDFPEIGDGEMPFFKEQALVNLLMNNRITESEAVQIIFNYIN